MSMIRRAARVRRRATREASRAAFNVLGRTARLDPALRRAAHGLEILPDVPYRETGERAHRLDIFRPARADGPRPALIYIHGGGFSMLSKETHWGMAVRYARRGFVVFNVEYRLAPRDRYPAAIDDVCAAFRWVVAHGAGHGADLSRLVFAGESAGGNLSLALAAATLWRRPEPFAAEVYDTGLVPRAVLPACGILQVSDPERFRRRRDLPSWLFEMIERTSDAYLPPDARAVGECPLADPLCIFEAPPPKDRPLPSFFVPCGTRDPILDDSRRLGRAIAALGGDAQVIIYPGGVHAFHAMPWSPLYRDCWRDTFRFLAERGLMD